MNVGVCQCDVVPYVFGKNYLSKPSAQIEILDSRISHISNKESIYSSSLL